MQQWLDSNRAGIINIVTRGTFWGAVQILTRNFLQLLLFIVLAKFLNVEDFGAISATLAGLSLIQSFIGAAVGQSTAKYIAEYCARDNDSVPSVLWTGLIISVTSSCAAGLLALGAGPWICSIIKRTELIKYIPFGVLWVISENLCIFTTLSMKALLRFRLCALTVIFGNVARFFLACILLIYARAQGALLGMAIGSLSEGLIGMVFLFRIIPPSRNGLWPLVKKIVKYSIPISLTGIGGFLYTQIDIVVLTIFSTFNEVAMYSLAFRVFMVPQQVMASFYQALSPIITRIYAMGNHQKLQSILSQSLSLMLIIGLICCLCMFVLAGPFLGMIRTEYKEAVPLIWIFALLIPPETISQLFSGSFGISTGNARIFAATVVIAGICNFALDILVVPFYGAVGCALVTLLVHLLTMAGVIIVLLRRLQLVFRFAWPNIPMLRAQFRDRKIYGKATLL